jgi:hypothetical protein
MADSYVGARVVRSLGSIATHSIADVYASPAYAKTRSMVSDPRRATEIGGHFCEGCKVLTH